MKALPTWLMAITVLCIVLKPNFARATEDHGREVGDHDR
jgi:hypothetical protein